MIGWYSPKPCREGRPATLRRANARERAGSRGSCACIPFLRRIPVYRQTPDTRGNPAYPSQWGKVDPRSLDYPRQTLRPAINPRTPLLIMIVQPTMDIALRCLSIQRAGALPGLRVFGPVCAAQIAVLGKTALIFLRPLYPRLTPAPLRNQCRFEPSYATYRMVALRKYGLCQGLRLGMHRIHQCRHKDGGFDNP